MMIAAVLDLLRVSGLAQGVVEWASGWLPLYTMGLGWLVPGIIGTVVGLIAMKFTKRNA